MYVEGRLRLPRGAARRRQRSRAVGTQPPQPQPRTSKAARSPTRSPAAQRPTARVRVRPSPHTSTGTCRPPRPLRRALRTRTSRSSRRRQWWSLRAHRSRSPRTRSSCRAPASRSIAAPPARTSFAHLRARTKTRIVFILLSAGVEVEHCPNVNPDLRYRMYSLV